MEISPHQTALGSTHQAGHQVSDNLSPRAASGRLRLGIAMLGGSLVLAIIITKLGVAWPWRVLLFAPFFLASNTFYQGLYRA